MFYEDSHFQIDVSIVTASNCRTYVEAGIAAGYFEKSNDHYPWSVDPEAFKTDFHFWEILSECDKLGSSAGVQ